MPSQWPNEIAPAQAINATASFLHPLRLSGSLFIKLICQAGMVWALCKARLTRLRLCGNGKKTSHAEIWKRDLSLQAPWSNLILASWKKLPVCEFSAALPRIQRERKRGAGVCHRAQRGLSTVPETERKWRGRRERKCGRRGKRVTGNLQADSEPAGFFYAFCSLTRVLWDSHRHLF